MTRLSGCLDELSTGQRRVLVLRAGVGAARPHSRRAVARTLHIPVRRVGRLERTGLREARALSRSGACGGGGSSSSSRGGGTTSAAALGIAANDTPGGGSGTGATADDGGKGGDASGGPAPITEDEGGVRGESDTRTAPIPRGTGPSGGVAIALAIALIALAAVAGYATPHLRGRLRSN